MSKRACMREWTTDGGVLGSNHMCVGDHDHAGDHKCGSCDATCARAGRGLGCPSSIGWRCLVNFPHDNPMGR